MIRALSIALDKSWEETYTEICIQGYKLSDMPSSNYVWGQYLKSKGFTRHTAERDENVAEFVANHREGMYVLGCDSHVVAAAEGCYYDAWDSGNEPVIYYWTDKE